MDAASWRKEGGREGKRKEEMRDCGGGARARARARNFVY